MGKPDGVAIVALFIQARTQTRDVTLSSVAQFSNKSTCMYIYMHVYIVGPPDSRPQMVIIMGVGRFSKLFEHSTHGLVWEPSLYSHIV